MSVSGSNVIEFPTIDIRLRRALQCQHLKQLGRNMTMNDLTKNRAPNLDLAEDILVAAIAFHKSQLEVAELALKALQNGKAEHVTPVVKSGQYQSFRAIDALVNYLTIRKGAVPLKEAVAELVAGGVIPGTPRGNVTDPQGLIEWQLRIALAQKGDVIGWSPEGPLKGVPSDQITIWLREEKTKKKA